MKAILAQFCYETNTFSPEVATVEKLFRELGVWRSGPEAVRASSSRIRDELAGSLSFLDAHDWDAVPVFIASANSSAGRLDAEGYSILRSTVRDEIEKALPADVVILHLHGAACAEGVDDTEGDLLAMIREELGFAGRIVVSLDLHANVTRKMFTHADAITAYRTFPHVDSYETGARAAGLAVQSADMHCAVAKIGMILSPTSARDHAGDLARMLTQARRAEATEGIDEISLLPVQPWLDVEEFGTSIVVTGRGDKLTQTAGALAEDWYAHRACYPTHLMPMADILEALRTKKAQPWILADTADAVTGGATGRSAYLLQKLLPHAASFEGPILLHVVDPKAVEDARSGETSFSLGEQKVPFTADRVRTAEGRFTTRGPGSRHTPFSMGGAAILEQGMLTVVACCEPTLGNTDPAFYECVGLDPDAALAVQVKSLTGWMSGYEADETRGLYIDGPGATSLNFASLPFGEQNRGLFPMSDPAVTPIAIWDSN